MAAHLLDWICYVTQERFGAVAALTLPIILVGIPLLLPEHLYHEVTLLGAPGVVRVSGEMTADDPDLPGQITVNATWTASMACPGGVVTRYWLLRSGIEIPAPATDASSPVLRDPVKVLQNRLGRGFFYLRFNTVVVPHDALQLNWKISANADQCTDNQTHAEVVGVMNVPHAIERLPRPDGLSWEDGRASQLHHAVDRMF